MAGISFARMAVTLLCGSAIISCPVLAQTVSAGTAVQATLSQKAARDASSQAGGPVADSSAPIDDIVVTGTADRAGLRKFDASYLISTATAIRSARSSRPRTPTC